MHWARAPVAIWNGLDASVSPPRVTPYDNGAIFTGSGTVVNGSMKLIYPGLCSPNATGAGCPIASGRGHQCTLNVALPADATGESVLGYWVGTRRLVPYSSPRPAWFYPRS